MNRFSQNCRNYCNYFFSVNIQLQLFFKNEQYYCNTIFPTPTSALNAGAKRSGATCHMAMPQYCYLAKGAKRPSHTTNMLIATKYNQMKLIADMEFFRRIE